MFSEALEIMDRNTINLMIDDLKKEIEERIMQWRKKIMPLRKRMLK